MGLRRRMGWLMGVRIEGGEMGFVVDFCDVYECNEELCLVCLVQDLVS